MRAEGPPIAGVDNKIGGLSYDDIYEQAWASCLEECAKTLERVDRERAEAVKSMQNFRSELEQLRKQYPDDVPSQVLMLLLPTLKHYEAFAEVFIKMMAHPVDVSMLWGLLFLVLLLALEREGVLDRISKMLKKIGDQLHAADDSAETIKDFTTVRDDAVEVNTNMMMLWLNIIMVFRTTGLKADSVERYALEKVNELSGEAYENIKSAVKRMEKAADKVERQAQILNMETFQKLFALSETSNADGKTPCHTLPHAENRRFYGRDTVLARIDAILNPTNSTSGMSSLAVHGLGGIGKTQVALAYAYSKIDTLDAVFWVYGLTDLTVKQGFTKIAQTLQLPQADPHALNQNMVLVLDWLQKTDKKWLLIFDNVDNHSIFNESWPAARHGAILITTRNASIATQPIDLELRLEEFSPQEGADLILHLLPPSYKKEEKRSDTLALSRKLGGHALAINQMTAFIAARGVRIKNFLDMYDKHAHRLHKEKRAGFRYVGYEYSLDTVFDISFGALNANAKSYMGVLSFMTSDGIPMTLFELDTSPGAVEREHHGFEEFTPSTIGFIMNELDRDDALEELMTQGLVRHNSETRMLFVHPLVQVEYFHRMENPQDNFESAVYLLLRKFPAQTQLLQNDRLWVVAEHYLQHVLKLIDNFKNSQLTDQPLLANLNFCKLIAKATWFVHDNDTQGIFDSLLDFGLTTYKMLSQEEKDEKLYTFLLSILGLRRLTTVEYEKGEKEMKECLEILKRILPEDDIQFADDNMYLAMLVGSQGRYAEAAGYFKKAKIVLDGPAGEVPTRILVWDLNTARNHYCQGEYAQAESLLSDALSRSEKDGSWYYLTYTNIAFCSLYIRKEEYRQARKHVEEARRVIERSGTIARFSWQSGHCAYYESLTASVQDRSDDAISHAEKAVAIGKLCKAPTGILARATHLFSKALKAGGKAEEAERQREEAQRLRALLPRGSTDLDDESDHAYERIVKIDQR